MQREMRAATSHQFEYILAGTFRPENIDRVVDDLAGHNYNVVQPCVRAPGTHFYPSDIAPVHPYCRDYDFLGEFVDKAHKAGLQIYSYYPVFLEGGEGVSAAGGAGLGGPSGLLGGMLARHPEWACVAYKDGKYERVNWGCPSNDEYVDYVCRCVKEQAERYELDGIIWDFVRYNGRCYCDVCKRKYHEYTGGWLLSPDVLSREEAELRCDIIRDNVKKLNATVRAARPGIKTGAYVFPGRRGAVFTVFQDWLTLSMQCDVILPMYYGEIPQPRLKETLSEHVTLAQCPLVLGLLPSLGPGVKRGTEDELCEDIETLREVGYRGFFMLSYEPLFGWERSGAYSNEYWHTPHPPGAAKRITERVTAKKAANLW